MATVVAASSLSNIAFAAINNKKENTETENVTTEEQPNKSPDTNNVVIGDETTEPAVEENGTTEVEGTEEGTGTGEGTGTTGGEGDTFVEITHNHYYYLDVGLQFKPRVGVITSINNSGTLYPLGSVGYANGDETVYTDTDTPWSPMLEDIPDIVASIGREYRYGVLYNGYWNDPLTGGQQEMEVIMADSDIDSTDYSVERSWDNRDPGSVLSDDVGEGNEGATGKKEGFEEFYTDYEKKIYEPVADSPIWDAPCNYNSIQAMERRDYLHENYPEEYDDHTSSVLYPKDCHMITPYVGTTWYRESTTIKDTQDFSESSLLMLPRDYDESLISEELRRALNILGWDILLRDEWVGSMLYTSEGKDYYGYTYSNTNVLDKNTEAVGNNLLTQDYVLQSIYRALGVNCLTTQTYFYADKDLTVDFTPLAEKITVAMDKINQVQNRVDVFVTRTGLENYWNKAIEDGLVSNYGVSVLNNIDGAYKPYAVQVSDNILDDNKKDTFVDVTGLEYPAGTWVEATNTAYVDSTDGPMARISNYESLLKRIDYNRTKTITLAEFCVYVKRLMDIYGEEVLTDKEMDMLLVYHGTKLPYGLDNDEQFEAIKYLMAKGIVNDMMYWNGDLRLEDMLVILSRVKDEGSRLTYKELELTYDEALLDKGYYPANISIVEEPTVNVVAATHSNNYSYKDAEWFDYFIQIPSEVQVTQGGKLIDEYINPLFLTIENGYEKYTEDIYLTKAVNGQFHYISENARQYDGFEIVGKENLGDGYQYLHFRVSTDLLFDENGNKNTEYIKGNYLLINTTVQADSPQRWYVDWRGGVFRNPVAKKALTDVNDEDGGSTKEYRYNMYWDNSNYYSNNSRTISSTMKSLDPGIAFPDDTQSLREQSTAKSLIISLHPDGSVKDCRTYNYGTGILEPKVESTKYLTFDNAGWELKYCDYERYVTGWSVSLSENPLLTDVTSALGEMIPQYEMWFYVLCDPADENKLQSSLYWGSSDSKSLLVDKSNPTEVLAVDGVDVDYIAKSNGKYYYVVHDQSNTSSLGMNLHTETSGLNTTYSTGYIKNNNTVLVNSSDLIDLVELHTGYRNGIVTRIDSDVIMLTFEVDGASTLTDPIIHTIILNEPLKLLSINNTIYKIPDDEVLVVDNYEQNGYYLINYRAIMGWDSGYAVDGVSADGSVEISVGSFNQYSSTTVKNAFTFNEVTMYTRAIKDTPVISMNSAYNQASWLIYVSEKQGTWLFTFKANDIPCTNSVINRIKKDTSSEDYAFASSIYNNSAKYLDEFFGVSREGVSGLDGSTLIAAYNLTSGICPIVCSESEVAQDDSGGKLFFDSTTQCWYYIPYTSDNTSTGSDIALFGGSKFIQNKDHGDVVKSAEEHFNNYNLFVNKTLDLFYSGKIALPIVGYSTNSLVDISTNIVPGCAYGTIPSYTIGISPYEFNQEDLDKISYDKFYYRGEEVTTLLDTSLSNVVPYPYASVSRIMGLNSVDLKDMDSLPYIKYGNYSLAYKGNGIAVPASSFYTNAGRGLKQLTLSSTVVDILASSSKHDLVSTNAGISTIFTDNREHLADLATQASLQDIDQIPGVDWGKYTFDRLIHDIDNGLSIVLIIVLNFIPRAGIFIFVILIGLATVANAKPMKQFCHSVFDPFKLVSFGHLTVDTVDTRMLLISSMIGLAVFALFMDGTILNVLTWLVQFVSSFITR